MESSCGTFAPTGQCVCVRERERERASSCQQVCEVSLVSCEPLSLSGCRVQSLLQVHCHWLRGQIRQSPPPHHPHTLTTHTSHSQAYIYDLRALSPLHKLPSHSSTVTSLSFHPLTPMVCVVCVCVCVCVKLPLPLLAGYRNS